MYFLILSTNSRFRPSQLKMYLDLSVKGIPTFLYFLKNRLGPVLVCVYKKEYALFYWTCLGDEYFCGLLYINDWSCCAYELVKILAQNNWFFNNTHMLAKSSSWKVYLIGLICSRFWDRNENSMSGYLHNNQSTNQKNLLRPNIWLVASIYQVIIPSIRYLKTT